MDANSLNQFILVGFVGKDARALITKKTGRKFTVIDIATQEEYRGKEKPPPRWHQVQIWGTKMAPWAALAVKTGMQVIAKGRMQPRIIGTGDDRTRRVELKVEEFIILRGKKVVEPEIAPAPAVDPEEDPY